MPRSTPPILQLSLAGLVAFQVSGCGTTQLMSPYRNHPSAIDADAREWSGAPMYADKSGINISTAHDAEYLYVLVTATDQSLQSQILRGGFTIWFDPSGGSDEVIGVRYPIARPGGPPPRERPAQTGEPSLPDDMMAPSTLIGNPSMDMELLGPGEEDRMMVSLVTEKQVQVKLSNAAGALTYELRMPLRRDVQYPNGIGVTADRKIGIGLETQKGGSEGMDRPRGGRGGMTPPDGSGPPEGGPQGGGPRGGGRGGRQGGGPPGGGRSEGSPANPINVRITAQLEQ